MRRNRSYFFSGTGSEKFTDRPPPLIHYHIYSGDEERVIAKPDKGLMRKDSLLAEKDKIQAEDLWDKPLILSHQTSINSEMALWLKTDFLN